MSTKVSTEIKRLRIAVSKSNSKKKPKLMLKLAILLSKEAPGEALNFAKQAQKLAQKLALPYETALAQKTIGNVYFITNKISLAHKNYQSALIPAQLAADNRLLGDLYFNLGRTATRKKDFEAALTYLQASLEYRKLLKEQDDEIAALNHIGQVYWEIKDYEKATEYFGESAAKLNPATKLHLSAVVFNNLGNALIKIGKTSEAMEAYLTSLQCKEKLGNQESLATAYNNLGNLYFTCGEFIKAKDFYQKAVTSYEKSKDDKLAAFVYSNLGITYNELSNTKLALANHRKALRYFQQADLKDDKARALNNLGSVYLKTKDYDKALSYYQKALGIKLKSCNEEGLGVSYNSIAMVYYNKGDLLSAVEYLLLSEKYAHKSKNKKLLLEIYSYLSETFAALGDHKTAYEYGNKHRLADLEYYSEKSLNKLTETMVKYDVELKSNQINELTELQKVQKAMLDNQIQAKIRYMNLYRAKQKEVIKREKAQAELQKLNLELEHRIAKALEEYKLQQELIIHKSKLESLGVLAAGIAHEIYQPLSAISISINNMRNKAQKDELNSEYLNTKFNRISEDIQRIRQVIEHVRLFSRDQKNVELERIDINQTIREALGLIDYDLRRYNISVKLIIHNQPLFSIGSKFKLEQVFLNLITNARDAILERKERYNDCNQLIEIRLYPHQGSIMAEFTDYGIGINAEVVDKIFDPFFTTKNAEKGTGLGLSISYGIIKAMNGELSVKSKENEYTTFTVKLPELQELR